jgi:hypothetical protein
MEQLIQVAVALPLSLLHLLQSIPQARSHTANTQAMIAAGVRTDEQNDSIQGLYLVRAL